MKRTFYNADYYIDSNDQTGMTVKEMIDQGSELEDLTAVHSVLLLGDGYGVYIPSTFIKNFDLVQWHIEATDTDVDSIKLGPNGEWYWEAWNSLMGKAYSIDEHGLKYHLEQDGDLWAKAYIEYSPIESEEQ